MANALPGPPCDGSGTVKRLAILLAVLSTNCAASDVLVVQFLGAKEVSIEKSEIEQVRKLGNFGGPIVSVTLRGPQSAGQVIVGDPQRGSMMVYVNPIEEACARGVDEDVGRLGTVYTDEKFFRDYVGQERLDPSWQYWIAFTPSLCQSRGLTDFAPEIGAYFICAGQSETFRCIREHARDDYSAYFFIDSDQLAAWQKIDAEVAAYLNRVVRME